MSANSKFWDRIAARYARTSVADEASYQRKLAITRDYLGSDSEVLEIGCGTGSTALAHAPFARHILATDLSARMIEIARDKAEASATTNITFRQASFDELDLPATSCDVVMAHSVLHLLPNWVELIDAAARWLKPGGVLVTSTVCLADFAPPFRLLGLVTRLAAPLALLPRVEMLSEQDVANCLHAAGFNVEHQWTPGPNKAAFIVGRKPA